MPALVRSAPERLTDGVIAVRLRRESDVPAIAAASHDPQTRRWLRDEPMDDQASATSVARTEEQWRSGTSTPLVIADAATDEPLGLINLQFRDDETTTVAYSVFPTSRGRGIAPRAVRLVTDWAFQDLGLDRLFLEADAENTASLRVAEKCRFERIGTRTESDLRTTVVFGRSRT